MTFNKFALLLISAAVLVGCDLNTPVDRIETPATYEFTRNGASTVSFSGQTTRILMAEELSASMLDFANATDTSLIEMYRNEGLQGGDVDPFTSPELNAATKNIKSKIAASTDFFATNTASSVLLKSQFEAWIVGQTDDVFPNQNTAAEPGVAGQIADGTSVRYVNAKGIEYDQLVTKGMIGALMTDQMLNNYLSTSVLDEGTNREDNDNGVLVEGQNYTNMEHKWDEAYGYLFGTSSDPAYPLNSLGEDSFLNKYLARMENDEDFSGIATQIFNAFALGRAAIVEGDYELRDLQANIIRERVSLIIGVRAAYYLLTAANNLSGVSPDYGAAFHDLSEGYGFIFSLQFTRQPNTNAPYFTKSEVDAYLAQLEAGNGLWDVEPETLSTMASEIAERFRFSILDIID